jgi:hypothetical protein
MTVETRGYLMKGVYSRVRTLAAALSCTLIVACVPVKQDVKEELPKLTKGPEEAPQRTITNFSTALRCMDRKLIDYGVYDVSMLVEDIRDSTDKVKAGAKDMLISAISEMTRRSHAIRLIAFGSDSGNLVSFLVSANETSPYAVIPQYDIRGSITQMDKSVAAKDVSAGINISNVGVGGAKTANASVLALDLAVISTRDYSVIPGVVSKNSIVIFKEGQGADADASIGKFGINFSMNLTRSEGDAQALRNLIELAAIELVGKLTKTPYWNCLGVDADKPEIQSELYDWYYNLVADQQIVTYFQTHLANRGYYGGPVDGQYNAQLTDAVMNYQRGLGMEPTGNIDQELFSAFLNQPVPPKPVAPPEPEEVLNRLAAVDIRYADGKGPLLSRGEEFDVIVRPSQNAHMVCYFEIKDGSVQRFFPNRFTADSLVQAAAPLTLPGSMPFKLYASNDGSMERLACFSSPRPLMASLPANIKGTDFENLPVGSLEEVEAEIKAIVGADLGGQYFEIKVN